MADLRGRRLLGTGSGVECGVVRIKMGRGSIVMRRAGGGRQLCRLMMVSRAARQAHRRRRSLQGERRD